MESEKRLIDANALMDEFRRCIAERHDRERCVSEENCNACERECLWRRVVKNAPTVDAVEVVHGRNLDEDTPSLFECSVCHWSCNDTYYGDTADYNYCPNCGAKMDLEGSDGY